MIFKRILIFIAVCFMSVCIFLQPTMNEPQESKYYADGVYMTPYSMFDYDYIEDNLNVDTAEIDPDNMEEYQTDPGVIDTIADTYTRYLELKASGKYDENGNLISSGTSSDAPDADLNSLQDDTETDASAPEPAHEDTPNQALPTKAKSTPASRTGKKSVKTSVSSLNDDSTVYATKSGKKYHISPDCSNMTSPIKMTKQEAESSGRTYCKKCFE